MSVLVAQGLSKSFGALDVFAAVDCRVEHGDRIGLVGPNGEGKTTLLRMLAGLERARAVRRRSCAVRRRSCAVRRRARRVARRV